MELIPKGSPYNFPDEKKSNFFHHTISLPLFSSGLCVSKNYDNLNPCLDKISQKLINYATNLFINEYPQCWLLILFGVYYPYSRANSLYVENIKI